MGARLSTETDSIRRSIEVEYWVVDDEGVLTDPDGLVEGCDGAEREFVEPMIEIKTTPCTSSRELHRELFDRIDAVLGRARNQGKKLVPLSTPINADTIEDYDSERIAIQDRLLGEDLEYVRHCAGTHIHVEQQPGERTDQLNALIALDPALALVNSSRYYRGEELTAGARSRLYRRLAYETLPNQGQLWPYAESREAYARRVQRCYEEFLTQAAIHDIGRERVESVFTPEGAVWTPVQFREEFSTVEWRSPDTTVPSQVLTLADDVVAAVERAVEREVRIEGSAGRVTEEAVVLPTFRSVREYVDRAIRDGLCPTVESYLERMGLDVSAYEPISKAFEGTTSVSKGRAREIRLEYADRLERDVRRQRSIAAE